MASVAAIGGLFVFAASASGFASTYCVGMPTCAGGELVSKGEVTGKALQEGLEKAGEASGSTLLIGPGGYSRAGGFKYEGGDVTIRGAGEFETELTAEAANNETVLTVKPKAGTTANLSGLFAEIPRPVESVLTEGRS